MSNTTSNKTAILGVPVVSKKVAKKANGLFETQKVTTETRKITHGDYAGRFIRTHVRFDDNCGNGHHSFSITADIAKNRSFIERSSSVTGCLHKEVAEFFPELASLIKWHLCSTDGPMHYIRNTVYLAGDRDYDGKCKGKERELNRSRRVALWPDATDEELMVDSSELKKTLERRLPALIDDMRKDIENAGLTW